MQISAKDLGWLNTPDFCQRCFWIERHDRSLPFQTPFAGIFSSIDSYTKGIVSRHFSSQGRLPGWLSKIGEIDKLVSVKPAEFRMTKENSSLTGIPDELFRRRNGSYGIIDYKTARHTGTQDKLMPVYEVQLNGYALIAESLGMKPVNDLYLVYFEPPESSSFDELCKEHTTREGFDMPFKPSIVPVKKDTKMVEQLLSRADEIYSLKSPPEGKEGCENCKRLDELIHLAG
jgi:hypothetical protein